MIFYPGQMFIFHNEYDDTDEILFINHILPFNIKHFSCLVIVEKNKQYSGYQMEHIISEAWFYENRNRLDLVK